MPQKIILRRDELPSGLSARKIQTSGGVALLKPLQHLKCICGPARASLPCYNLCFIDPVILSPTSDILMCTPAHSSPFPLLPVASHSHSQRCRSFRPSPAKPLMPASLHLKLVALRLEAVASFFIWWHHVSVMGLAFKQRSDVTAVRAPLSNAGNGCWERAHWRLMSAAQLPCTHQMLLPSHIQHSQGLLEKHWRNPVEVVVMATVW